MPTPVTFTLRTQREVVQYRLDIRIPETGPLSRPPLIDTGADGLTAGDGTLTRVLEGIMPQDAVRLSLEGPGIDGRTSAYEFGGVTYVRTPLTLLSPSWSSSVKSADGMNVYKLGAAPVILLSDQGRVVRVQLSAPEGDEP